MKIRPSNYHYPSYFRLMVAKREMIVKRRIRTQEQTLDNWAKLWQICFKSGRLQVALRKSKLILFCIGWWFFPTHNYDTAKLIVLVDMLSLSCGTEKPKLFSTKIGQ